MVSMQDHDAIECAGEHRVHHVGLARYSKAHLQEVGRVIEVVARIDERLPDKILVGHRGDRRHLRNHAVAGDHTVARVVDVGGVVIEGRERAHHAAHYCHRMGVAAEPGVEPRHLLMHHGMVRDGVAKLVELGLRRQLAIQKQIADLDEVGLFGELVDRIAAVEEHALVAVDVGDFGRAVGGRGETGIVGKAARVAVEAANIDHVGTDGAGTHRHLCLLVVDEQRSRWAGVGPLARSVLCIHRVCSFNSASPRLQRPCRTNARCTAPKVYLLGANGNRPKGGKRSITPGLSGGRKFPRDRAPA